MDTKLCFYVSISKSMFLKNKFLKQKNETQMIPKGPYMFVVGGNICSCERFELPLFYDLSRAKLHFGSNLEPKHKN